MANVYRNIGAVVKDTGGLWDRLDDQMAARPAPAAGGGLGLWDLVVTGSVGGVWDEFDRETVLLRREHLERDGRDLWREAADETLILPRAGLLPVWDAVLARSDAAGELDLDGTLMMLRPEDESVWQRSADETLMLSRPAESIFAQQVRARDLTTYFPRRKPGYALKKLADARGETYWILKNLRTDAYLRLTAEQVFLWDQMDGESSVQDIAVAFMLEYGKLSIGGLIMLLDQLQQKGFIEPLVDIYGAVNQSVAQRRADVWWRQLIRRFTNTELAIHGIDGWITRSYRAGGRWLFAAPVQWAMLAIMVAGAVAFAGLLLGLIERDLSFIAGAGIGAVAGLISLYVLQAITLFVHEWAHALATKHYGREVRRGGFVLHFGMPAAFVDTTDIWMEPRRPRIVVSWAGPHSGFFLGGLASLAILALPGGVVASVLYRFAVLTYLTSFMNLNPLLKLDGYYILMDWLEIPRLRERSLAFIGRPLRDKLRRRERFTREELIFAVFGVLAALWTVIAVSATVRIAGKVVLDAAQTLPGQIAIGLLLAAVAIVLGRRTLRQARAARRRRAAA
jgi:putative peptide zinc metalloprotease protein